MLLTSKLDALNVSAICAIVSNARYAGNLTSRAEDAGKSRDGRHKVRFTLAVDDSFGRGARTAASGRHMPKASWQAHRDVMQELFRIDPDAVLKTALATYKGADDFTDKFEATGDRNVGSNFQPVALRNTEV